MSCRPDPAHSCLGCSLHTLGNLLCCLGSFLSIGSSPLRPLDSFSALFDSLGRIGFGLGCRLPALDGLLTIRSFRSTFPGYSLIALCTAGSLVFDTGCFPAFLDLPASEPCQFPAPITCGFRPLLDSSLRRTASDLQLYSPGRCPWLPAGWQMACPWFRSKPYLWYGATSPSWRFWARPPPYQRCGAYRLSALFLSLSRSFLLYGIGAGDLGGPRLFVLLFIVHSLFRFLGHPSCSSRSSSAAKKARPERGRPCAARFSSSLKRMSSCRAV